MWKNLNWEINDGVHDGSPQVPARQAGTKRFLARCQVFDFLPSLMAMNIFIRHQREDKFETAED